MMMMMMMMAADDYPSLPIKLNQIYTYPTSAVAGFELCFPDLPTSGLHRLHTHV